MPSLPIIQCANESLRILRAKTEMSGVFYSSEVMAHAHCGRRVLMAILLRSQPCWKTRKEHLFVLRFNYQPFSEKNFFGLLTHGNKDFNLLFVFTSSLAEKRRTSFFPLFNTMLQYETKPTTIVKSEPTPVPFLAKEQRRHKFHLCITTGDKPNRPTAHLPPLIMPPGGPMGPPRPMCGGIP